MDIIIIGGGQSGLVSCKTFVENNFNVIVLEKGDKNGLFNNVLEKEHFKWSSSRYISGFSDFPIPKNYPVWINFKEFCNYIELYKKTFNLDKYISYNSNVISTKKINKKWEVKYIQNNKIKIIYSDFLVISTGLNSVPKYPDLGKFTGEIIHTDTIYKKMNKNDWKKKFKNKKILLIGGGESALDIGHIVLNYTNKLYYTTKSYMEWFPDWGLDKEFLENNKYCISKLRYLDNPIPTDNYLSYLEYSLPTPISGFWHQFGRYLIVKIVRKLTNRNTNIKCSHNHKKLCDITYTPENLFAKPVIKRTPFICDIHNNKVNVIYYPNKFEKNYILSKDGKFEIDTIITGTGYKMYIPFVDEKYYNCNLIKKMLSPIDNTIAFVGFVRPTMGSINNISEMQSWWLVEFFKNNLNYKIRNLKWSRPEDPLNISKNVVIGNYYMKDLAMDLNILPNLTYIFFKDIKLWIKIMHTTIHPTLFRIYGSKKIKNGKQIYYDTFSSLNEKKEMHHYYLMFIIFHLLFLLFLFGISYIIYKNIKYKKKNVKHLLIIFIFIIYLSYYFML